jgi:hypothetical protein
MKVGGNVNSVLHHNQQDSLAINEDLMATILLWGGAARNNSMNKGVVRASTAWFVRAILPGSCAWVGAYFVAHQQR